MALKVALQLYSVRSLAENDFRGTLEKIKEMGYEGVEFAGIFSHTPKEVGTMCQEIGITPISAHVPLRDMLSDTKSVIADYAEIGCKYIAVPYLEPSDRPGSDGWENTVKNIEIIGKEARAQGLTLLYHNHDFEFIKINGKYALDVLYDTVAPEYLQTEIDTCWVNIGGENPSEYVKKYKGRAPIVHLKDFVGQKSENMYELIGIKNKSQETPSKFEFRPVGSGLQDFVSITKAAEYAESDWIVVEQDSPSMNLSDIECAQKGRQYLASIGY